MKTPSQPASPTSVGALAIYESGPQSAPLILLLHGLGVSSWMWQEQIQALQEDYHCLAVDLPGNGQSYQVHWRSLADTASRLAPLITAHAAAGKAHLVGLSLGGHTALALLAGYPHLVETVLVSGVTTRPFPRQWLYRPLMRLLGLAYRWDPTINLMARTLQLPDEALPLYRRDSKRLSAATYRRVNDELFHFSLSQRLPPFPHRLLALAGDQEARLIRQGLPDFLRLLPNATAALVPHAHHGWNGEHPQLFTATIRTWVEGLPLPSALQLIQ